jgi:hypothetical protein
MVKPKFIIGSLGIFLILICMSCISSSCSSLVAYTLSDNGDGDGDKKGLSAILPESVRPPAESPAKVPAAIKSYPEGVCTFAKAGKCPVGWDDKGIVGYDVREADKTKLGFRVGAADRTGWPWQHPHLCCKTSAAYTGSSDEIAPSVINAGSCTGGAGSRMIHWTTPTDNSGLTKGANYYKEWKFKNLYVCPNKTMKSGNYMLGAQCPTGWSDKGRVGIISPNANIGNIPGAAGGKYNSGWTWRHPQICKKD